MFSLGALSRYTSPNRQHMRQLLRVVNRCGYAPPLGIFIRNHHSRNDLKTVLIGGPVGAPAHRLYFSRNESPISPWHDIPLAATDGNPGEYNMVCEIPRWSNAKLEIDTKAPLNPIKHDVKNGKLRYVANVFPYKGYIWNYGALPQTFEDPNVVDTDTGYVGDNDPIDVLEIGREICAEGSVHRVKALGVLALVDDSETDWKVLAIRTDDPLAKKINGIDDLELHMPGLIKATVDWFTKYKVPDGKPPNRWAFGGKPKDAAYARGVISSAHESWRKLVLGPQSNELILTNVSVESSAHYLRPSHASDAFKALVSGGPLNVKEQPEDPQAKKNAEWHFVRDDIIQ
ncbi:inorganic pyrophosphatase [Coemansia reversa NRRL 1564]|uniref:inorganic diphosphatase n=1 Tax=Coemansia reversa (strain ATCC 12441 / NRRL 1564) TaxID=763665 RepID=A0A2G5B4I0_COERN|nr:inorganic pyrophosphatase [Coemansia reversa NRRL 1564]|eukprot:PIA13909.1 inorganic pyrophosphatase [Coemansia reversa NRRL 1564]